MGLAVAGAWWGDLAMAMTIPFSGRGVAYFHRLIFVAFFVCGALPSYASIPPLIQYTIGGLVGSSPNEVFTAWVLTLGPRASSQGCTGNSCVMKDQICSNGGVNVSTGAACNPDPIYNPITYSDHLVSEILACPADSTASGSVCICSAGFVQAGSQCLPDTNSPGGSPSDICDAMNATGVVYSRGGALGSSACMSGTTVQASMAATGAAGTSYAGKTLLYGPFSCSGEPCTNGPSNTASQNAPEPCMRPKQSGIVNGISVCLDAPSTLAPGSSTVAPTPAGSASSPSSGLGANAPSSATSSSVETTCAGGSCTTNTVFKDSSGAVVGEKAETKPQSSFCDENPSSPMCAESRFSGGGCGAPDSCSGDAVLCAIQAQAKATACRLEDVFKPDDGASSVGAAALSGADGINTDAMKVAAAASPVNVGSFDSSGRGWSRACPSDPVFDIPFGTATSWTMPISRICSPLGILANFGVGITLLASLIWVIGGRKT